jgi:serine beta-lactamase-like protein LACTB, mitochondrial
MAKSWNRTETWLALVVGAAALIMLAVAGLWVYVSATTTPLHPTAQSVASVGAAPAPQWAGVVEEGRQIVRAALAEQNLPGVSVAVGVGGAIVWAEGFGWANLENKVPVSPDTRFRIGTASTALTSAAVGLLLEQERLRLDEPIRTHVPEFPEQKWPVTLREVMGSVAGIRSDGGDEGPLFGERCDRPVEALQHFDPALRFEPGTEFRPSNFGWILVSAAVEAAASEPFLLFMHRRIFEPLHMRHTDADTATEPSPDLATSYFPRFAADPRYGPDVMRPIELSCYSGSSVFVSTPSDLVRFAIAINSGTLLQPATVRLLQTSQRLASGQETGYGLGWDLETVTLNGKQALMAGHDGEVLGGTVSSLLTFPERGLVVAVLSNTSYADTPSLGLAVAQAFAEKAVRRTEAATRQ